MEHDTCVTVRAWFMNADQLYTVMFVSNDGIFEHDFLKPICATGSCAVFVNSRYGRGSLN